jgi:hypothetical protein
VKEPPTPTDPMLSSEARPCGEGAAGAMGAALTARWVAGAPAPDGHERARPGRLGRRRASPQQDGHRGRLGPRPPSVRTWSAHRRGPSIRHVPSSTLPDCASDAGGHCGRERQDEPDGFEVRVIQGGRRGSSVSSPPDTSRTRPLKQARIVSPGPLEDVAAHVGRSRPTRGRRRAKSPS